MNILLFILFVVAVVIGVLLLQVLFAMGIYYLLAWAGAPKWVAMLSSIGYFVITGWVFNLSYQKE